MNLFLIDFSVFPVSFFGSTLLSLPWALLHSRDLSLDPCQWFGLSVDDIELFFENSMSRMVAKRSCPEIEIAGEKIGAFDEGDEFQARFWVGYILSDLGLADFQDEDLLDLVKLHKLYWKESIQSGKRLSSLPEFFYSKLRRFLLDLRKKSNDDPALMAGYHKARRLSQDILSCRLKKIVGLSAAPTQTGDVLEAMTSEERDLYSRLNEAICDWKSKIIKIR